MRSKSFPEICVILKNERAWYGNMKAFWNFIRKFIVLNVLRMRFVKDSDACLAVRILGMTFAYYKAEPVLMSDGLYSEIERKREFGEVIKPYGE